MQTNGGGKKKKILALKVSFEKATVDKTVPKLELRHIYSNAENTLQQKTDKTGCNLAATGGSREKTTALQGCTGGSQTIQSQGRRGPVPVGANRTSADSTATAGAGACPEKTTDKGENT